MPASQGHAAEVDVTSIPVVARHLSEDPQQKSIATIGLLYSDHNVTDPGERFGPRNCMMVRMMMYYIDKWQTSLQVVAIPAYVRTTFADRGATRCRWTCLGDEVHPLSESVPCARSRS